MPAKAILTFEIMFPPGREKECIAWYHKTQMPFHMKTIPETVAVSLYEPLGPGEERVGVGRERPKYMFILEFENEAAMEAIEESRWAAIIENRRKHGWAEDRGFTVIRQSKYKVASP